MNIYASIAMTFIPLVTVYICFLLLGKDFNKVHGAAACLCGLLALLPIELLLIIIHTWHPFASVNLPGRLIKGLLINGIIEESAKMAFLFLLPAKKSKLSAFFSYAVLCGLTLGCLETLIYLIYGNRSITLRLFTAVVMHTFCAGLSGLFVYCIKRRQELADKSLLWLPFVLAVLFHGLYNYFAGIYGTLHYFAYAVIVATILECKLRYQSVKIKFERKASVNTGLENQGDAKKMGFGNFFKKVFGSSDEEKATEKTQVQESAQTVAEDDATIADDATMVDSDSTLVSEDNSSDETISSDVQADMSFAMHTAAEFASDKPRSDDKFAEALKLVDVFDEDKDPQPDPISETEAFESIEKAEKAVTKSTRGRKKGSTVKKTAEKAVKEAKTTAKKTAKTAEKKASAAKKAVTKKATAAKKTAEKAVKEAKTTAKKTAKTAEKKVSAAKKAVTKKATAAKKTAEKAVKKTAAKASTAKKTAASKAAGAKASATKKVKAAKATVAKKSATLKATKASAAKKTATAKATTAKKTAAKKTTK
ncbi:MAG: PrsW family intramembrane metalloprotease [Treponema sp.]|nr:PrsW family intramembrane metalloprotease [Treponema sp.]